MGEGGCGEVWIGRVYGDGQDRSFSYAAIKVELKPTENNELERESSVMRAIGRHENIIGHIEFAKNVERHFVQTGENKIISYLAMEFALNKNLLEYLMHQSGRGYV